MRNHIVILGGMGPQASARLHELIIAKTPAFITGAPVEFPAIMHASMQIPDFISNTSNIETAVSIIRDTMKMMNIDEARSIGLACNTAHLLTHRLGLDRDNFVSMVDAVCEDVSRSGLKRIGLLASPHTHKTGMYSTPLHKAGLEILEPTASEIDALEEIIRDVIAGKSQSTLRRQLDSLAKRLIERGAEAILLGCTELPIIGLSLPIKTFDSLSALADKLLERHFVIQGQTKL